jgi:hypothetical protein
MVLLEFTLHNHPRWVMPTHPTIHYTSLIAQDLSLREGRV